MATQVKIQTPPQAPAQSTPANNNNSSENSYNPNNPSVIKLPDSAIQQSVEDTNQTDKSNTFKQQKKETNGTRGTVKAQQDNINPLDEEKEEKKEVANANETKASFDKKMKELSSSIRTKFRDKIDKSLLNSTLVMLYSIKESDAELTRHFGKDYTPLPQHNMLFDLVDQEGDEMFLNPNDKKNPIQGVCQGMVITDITTGVISAKNTRDNFKQSIKNWLDVQKEIPKEETEKQKKSIDESEKQTINIKNSIIEQSKKITHFDYSEKINTKNSKLMEYLGKISDTLPEGTLFSLDGSRHVMTLMKTDEGHLTIHDPNTGIIINFDYKKTENWEAIRSCLDELKAGVGDISIGLPGEKGKNEHLEEINKLIKTANEQADEQAKKLEEESKKRAKEESENGSTNEAPTAPAKRKKRGKRKNNPNTLKTTDDTEKTKYGQGMFKSDKT
ncbi:hypothetical protein [Thalassomonas sp. RHCl1]|uniref:hypothetical protein n=1 Tax=Thalassomonas sp. RHCl1 TaxID=2995320 RepID=UPI00248AB3F2|nr:hypothetical protein [Thalassomonas sp. RHCl1]